MPDKIMIAGESSFIAKLGVGDLRNGINMYRHSQAAPVDFEIADHDWSVWGKAAAAQAIPAVCGLTTQTDTADTWADCTICRR